MIYTFILVDRPAASELRQRMRPEHKAYLGEVADRIAFAGPLTHDDGTTMIGTASGGRYSPASLSRMLTSSRSETLSHFDTM